VEGDWKMLSKINGIENVVNLLSKLSVPMQNLFPIAKNTIIHLS